MFKDKDKDKSSPPPFFLSKVNNKALREISTHLMLPSLYNHLYPIVNEKGVSFFAHFKTSVLLVQNKLQYILSFQLVIIMNLIIKDPSNKLLADILYTYLQDKYPILSKKAQQALLKLLYFYNCSEIIHTSNQELQILFSCNKRNAQKITEELAKYGIIIKIQNESENYLRISINLLNISNIKFKQTEFLATYIKTETWYIKGTAFKVALFKDIHDLENIITLKTDRISYDDETSYFLKELNAGDIISYTPSVTRPTIKGIKHPLNLKIYSKAETEENMTFFAKFDVIEVQTYERFEPTNRVRFSDVRNINQTIYIDHAWQDLKPECLNSKALESLKPEEGDYLCFKARVKKTERGYCLSKIHSILAIEAFYNNQYGEI